MDCRYYYPFIGALQSLVSSYRVFFTPIRVQHYTPSTVYDELTEIPKQLGAIIDMTLGMNIAQRNLFYKIKGTMMAGEQITRMFMLLNYNATDEPTFRVLTHGLRGGATRTGSGGSDMDCSILVLLTPISYRWRYSLQHDYDGIVDAFNIYSLFRRTRYYSALFKYSSSSHN